MEIILPSKIEIEQATAIFKGEKDLLKPIEARDFEQSEISDINRYINVNVPYSVLQQIYPLTENLLNKSKVYTIMYRIIYGTANYVEKEETKIKLNKLLEENKDLYSEIYNLIINHENNTLNFGQRSTILKLKTVFYDMEKNFKINKLIDIFLIFSERVTLLRTDNFVSIDMENKEGEEVYNKLVAAIDKPAEVQEGQENLDDDYSDDEIPNEKIEDIAEAEGEETEEPEAKAAEAS